MLYVIGIGSAANAGNAVEGSVTMAGGIGPISGSSIGVRGDGVGGVGGVDFGSHADDDDGAASDLSVEEVSLAIRTSMAMGGSFTREGSMTMKVLLVMKVGRMEGVDAAGDGTQLENEPGRRCPDLSEKSTPQSSSRHSSMIYSLNICAAISLSSSASRKPKALGSSKGERESSMSWAW